MVEPSTIRNYASIAPKSHATLSNSSALVKHADQIVKPPIYVVIQQCKTYDQLKDAILSSFQDPLERRAFVYDLLETFENGAERFEMLMSFLLDFCNSDNVDLSLNVDESKKRFPRIHRLAAEGKKTQNRIEESKRRIEKKWGLDVLTYIELQPLLQADNGARGLATLADAAYSYENAASLLNAALLHRLDHPGRGKRKDAKYMPADCTMAIASATHANNTHDQQVIGEEKELLASATRHKLTQDPASKLYSLLSSEEVAGSVLEIVSSSDERIDSIPTTPTGRDSPHRLSLATLNLERTMSTRRRSGSDYSPLSSPTLMESSDSDLSSLDSSEVSRLGRQVEDVAESMSDTGSASPPPRSAEACECIRIATGNLRLVVQPAVLHELNNIYAGGRARFVPDEDGITLLMRFGQALHSASDQEKYCMQHLRYMGGIIGLQIQRHNRQSLASLLYFLSRNRAAVPRAKVEHDYYQYFRKSRRPAHPADTLEVYRFFPVPRVTDNLRFYQLDSGKYAERLALICGITKSQREEWRANGTVNVGSIFNWWKETILAHVKEEFNMYLWHQRQMNDKPNLGWLRTMVHSVSQQLMRQDVRYWALYVLLRGDMCTWLISYPYYTKYQLKGDQTAFRHIDLNVHQMAVVGRGVNQIQGSLSLDDETDSDCTVIVPGMHKDDNLKEWARRLTERGLSQTAFVHKIDSTLWTPRDAENFQTDWTKVPCNELEVRVSDPRLPHGAMGPAKNVRRTMLPWFVAVSTNHVDLEVHEAGSYKEVAKAHRDRTAPPKTPSGLANKYGSIPYRFPASVKLSPGNALSEAMTGQRLYTDPEVVKFIDQLLHDTDTNVKALLETMEVIMKDKALKAWAEVRDLEKGAYSHEKSYFWNLERHGVTGMQPHNWPCPAPDTAPHDIKDDSENEDWEDEEWEDEE